MTTLNLLPPKEKKIILAEQTNRRVIFWGVNFVTALLVFIVLLGLIYALINIKLKIAGADLKNARAKFNIEGFQDLQAKIKQANDQIKNLDKIQTEHKYYSLALEKIVDITPAAVLIKRISINQNQMTIEGFSPTREAILIIKQALEKSPDFEKIESPISNLLKPTDIDFRFSLVLKEKSLEYNASTVTSP